MAFQTFTIPVKAEALNAVLNALANCQAHKRKWVLKNFQETWKDLTNIYAGKIKPVESFPAEISIHARFKTARTRDICDLYCKSIIDQLVIMGVFPDDNLEYVDKVSFGGEIGSKNDEIIVVITSS